MKSLAEWIKVTATSSDVEGASAAVPHTALVVDNLVASWGGIAFAELSVLVVHLRYLALVHQTHHWISRGDSFYGDHKLFEELYNAIVDEIDMVAEKAVGLGGEQNVNLALQVSQLMGLCKAYGSPQTVPQSCDLAKASLVAECNLLKVIQASSDCMEANGTMTPGIENMLQALYDAHEKHVYLLKRRCSQSPMGF